ncbi:MAG: ribosomal protein S18-alanine N-acetyltransferase [Cyanobacteria bacterium J06626_14]
MKALAVRFLVETWLPQTLRLDTLCFGGLWNESGYRREIESPNSDLIVLRGVMDPSVSPGFNLAPDPLHQQDTSKNIGYDIEQKSAEDFMLGISCSWAIVDEAHITLLGVHPDFRRQGLGMLMLWVQFQLAYQRGMKRATLEVRSSNKGAIALYKRFGFKQAGIRKGYYRQTGEDALILWRGGLQETGFQAELNEWKRQVTILLSQAGWIANVRAVLPADLSLIESN